PCPRRSGQVDAAVLGDARRLQPVHHPADRPGIVEPAWPGFRGDRPLPRWPGTDPGRCRSAVTDGEPAALSRATRLRGDCHAASAGLAGTCGKRVEVTGERTEYSQVFANPAGYYTLEQHVEPIFAHVGDGSWHSIDTTLHLAADGTIAPAATALPVSFSGGG